MEIVTQKQQEVKTGEIHDRVQKIVIILISRYRDNVAPVNCQLRCLVKERGRHVASVGREERYAVQIVQKLFPRTLHDFPHPKSQFPAHIRSQLPHTFHNFYKLFGLHMSTSQLSNLELVFALFLMTVYKNQQEISALFSYEQCNLH